MSSLQERYPEIALPDDDQMLVLRAPQLGVQVFGLDHVAFGTCDIALYRSLRDKEAQSRVRDIIFPHLVTGEVPTLLTNEALGIVLPGSLVKVLEVSGVCNWPDKAAEEEALRRKAYPSAKYSDGPVTAYLDRSSPYLHSFITAETRRALEVALGITITE